MTTLVGALAAPLLIFAMALPCHADSMCKDGTTSTATGRGACSGHGGVQKAGKSAAAAPAATESASPAAAPAPAAESKAAPAASKSAPAAKSAATAGNTDPTGATAKCKDGTYSKSKHHTGSCSHHGGVAEFLTP